MDATKPPLTISSEAYRKAGVGFERFEELAEALNAKKPVFRSYVDLVIQHSTPPRSYHTLDGHVSHLLSEYDNLQTPANNPAALQASIWLHDAVYNPTREDNEERSAQYAQQLLSSLEVDARVQEQTKQLILATKHHLPATHDQQLLCDLDLTILGQEKAVYDTYKEQVREEHAFVEPEVYSQKRAEVLQEFLNKPRIYHTQELRGAYEKKARKNVEQEINELLIQ